MNIDNVIVEEGSTLHFTANVSNPIAMAMPVKFSITPNTTINTAESNDYGIIVVKYYDSNNVLQTTPLTVTNNEDGTFSVTVPAMVTKLDIAVPSINDNVYEGAEQFNLNVIVDNGGTPYITTGVGTIKDDGSATDGDDSDSTVDNDTTKFSIADAEVYEGNNIIFTVTRIGDAEANQTVNYTVSIESGNTAESEDFTGTLSGTLTFAKGETTKTITLNAPLITDSNADTGDDTFTVTLSNNSAGSTIVDAIAIGTIKESNTPPTGTDEVIVLGKNTTNVLTVSDFGYSDIDNDAFSGIKITNLETSGSLMYFDTSLSTPTWLDVTLNQFISKTAIENGYLIFKPVTNAVGIPYSSFQFEVNDGTAYSTSSNTITYNIGNTLSVSNPLPVDEGKSAIFTISLDEARTSNTLLNLSIGGTNTTDGDSTDDYNTTLYYKKWADNGQSWTWETATSDQVTILQGQISIEVKVVTLIDTNDDNGESLTLTASINGDTTGMANTTATGTTTINDYPSLRIDTKPYITEGDYAIFEITLTAPKSTATVVTLGGGGTATMGTDYSQNYEYWLGDYNDDGSENWQTVILVAGVPTITIPAAVDNISTTNVDESKVIPSVLLRTLTATNDGNEPDETIILIATPSDSDTRIVQQSVSTTTTILDKVTLEVYENGDDTNLALQDNFTTLSSTGYIYEVAGQGTNGTVTQDGNNLIYTPTVDFSGTDYFTYTRINTTTGLSITGVAEVIVHANADTPEITIDVSNKVTNTVSTNVITNGDFSTTAAWKLGSNIATDNYSNLSNFTPTSSQAVLSNSNPYIIQAISVNSGVSYTLNYTVIQNYSDLHIYFASINSLTGAITKIGSDLDTATSTGAKSVTGTIPSGVDAIIYETTQNNNGTNTVVTFDTISLFTNVTTYTYNVNISNNLLDIDGSETLSGVTISGVPTGATFNQGTNNNDGTWTFTQSQLAGLKITTSSTSFTLTSIVHSIDGTSTSPNASDFVTVSSSNLLPLIGDSTIGVSNLSGATSTTNITTTYGNGVNLFSWDIAKTSIPELYADGQKVVINYDNTTKTITGTIDDINNGTKTIFTTTANFATLTEGSTGTSSITYTQGLEVMGVKTLVDGNIILPGGGNQDYRVFQFTQSSSDDTVVVDALVVAHDLIEDSTSDLTDSDAEHTVNTNNYYIGVDSNNMNAGQQLIFDFDIEATYDGITTHSNEVTEINIKLFNFDSAKSGDELYITVITKNPDYIVGGTAPKFIREDILLTQNDDYSTELEYTVTSKTGNPIVGVEFLAGNNSSFKLGIESIGVVDYSKTFNMDFVYDITDTDGDSDMGHTTVTVGGGTADTTLTLVPDSNILYDSSDKIIDGGTGIDTLILGSNIDIDFSSYANSIKNIEIIDLENSTTDNVLSKITIEDVISMTDSNNLLTILGDGDGTLANSDSVTLQNTTGVAGTWSQGTTVDGFATYANGDNSVSLKIDDNINVSIIPVI